MSSSNQETETHQTPSNQQQENPISQETQTHQAPFKQQESPVQETSQFSISETTKLQVADAIFLTGLLSYKVSFGPLPSFDDDPLTRHGQELLKYVNADLDIGEPIDETLFRDKALMLRSRYEKVVEERSGKNEQEDEDKSTDSEKLVFMLSERLWSPEYDDYGFAEVDGNRQGSENDQDQQVFLFPKSTSEQEDDIATLVNVNLYSMSDARSLADFINSNRRNRGCVDEARLREKILKLKTSYRRIVEEKGKNLDNEDFLTYNEHLIFRLSNKAWGKDQPEANV